MKVFLKNESPSSRGIYSVIGRIVALAPGEAKEVDLSAATIDLVRKSQCWSIVDPAEEGGIDQDDDGGDGHDDEDTED